jgi:hypothetical protein
MADAVDAEVYTEQAAVLDARLDLLRRHPRAKKLRSRDHPVAHAGDSRQFFFDRPVWWLHANR